MEATAKKALKIAIAAYIAFWLYERFNPATLGNVVSTNPEPQKETFPPVH